MWPFGGSKHKGRQLVESGALLLFGIITQIDIQETFKVKLGVDFRRYRIFGACNPSFAHTALQNDPRVGVLLPCNVVLYEKDDGKAVVGAVDPMQTLGAGGGSRGLADVAREVGAGGAVLGFGYHRFVGCRTGACAITANPYISTLYGALMGYLLSGGVR